MDSIVTARLRTALPDRDQPLGYLFWLSRPRFWFYLAGPVIVGTVYAADSVSTLFSPLAVALFGYFLVPANVFLYGVNDAFDRDIDATNPKKAASGREVRFRQRRYVSAVVILAGLLVMPLFTVLPPLGMVALASWLLLSVEYSAPPLRFKTTPLLDSLSNGLYILPGVAAYAAIAGNAPPAAAVVGGWLWTMGMHTFSAVPDIEPDRAAGIQTTATRLGAKRTYAYCGACWLGAAVAFATLHPALGFLLGVYPVLAAVVGLADIDSARAYWWFPVINVVVGMLMTLGGLWVMLYG
jgi:4-hydroxybenzoate polyprenyltransferase